MKRVNVLMAVLPAAAGLTWPAATAAAAGRPAPAPRVKTVSVHPLAAVPDTSGRVCSGQNGGQVCLQVFGSGNYVTQVNLSVTHPRNETDTVLVSVSNPLAPPGQSLGVWKSKAYAAWNGEKKTFWTPHCSWKGDRSFPSIVMGGDYRSLGDPAVSVHGTNYTGKHPCGFIHS
jgi:hypothetical protein